MPELLPERPSHLVGRVIPPLLAQPGDLLLHLPDPGGNLAALAPGLFLSAPEMPELLLDRPFHLVGLVIPALLAKHGRFLSHLPDPGPKLGAPAFILVAPPLPFLRLRGLRQHEGQNQDGRRVT